MLKFLLKWALVSVIAVAIFFLGYYCRQAKSYIKVVYLKDQEKSFESDEVNRPIKIGVVIPQDHPMFSKDELQNQEFAKTHLVKANWQHWHTEKEMLPGHYVIIFKLMPKDDVLVLR